MQIPKIRHDKVEVFDSENNRLSASKKFIHRIPVRRSLLPQQINELPFAFAPVEDSFGRVRGLMVREKIQIPVKTVLGFTKGDILTSVGRVPVTSPEHLRRLLQKIRYTGEASATIERKGEPHKLFFQLVQ